MNKADFIKDNKIAYTTVYKKDLEKYVNFIQSQMSRNELHVIVTHGKSFQRFKELLDKTHLTDITTNNEL